MPDSLEDTVRRVAEASKFCKADIAALAAGLASVGESAKDAFERMACLLYTSHNVQTCDIDAMGLLCRNELQNVERLERSMGTLGGGNHFVELDIAGNGDTYLVVHSGSRNLGLQVAKIYQQKAVETCKEPTPKGLEYLTSELRDAYLHDMRLCQRWAALNREAMMHAIDREARLGVLMGGTFHTVHNLSLIHI